MRRIGVVLLSGAVALALFVAPAGARSSALARSAKVKCPLSVGEPTGGNVQWAFSDSTLPQGHAVRSSYVHGRGNWTAGRAAGTACTTDALSRGGVRDLVLGIDGSSKLTGRVHQSGMLGVRLVLPVRVRASDDAACRAGTTGTITLFASYYGVHVDTAQIHFAPACRGHNLSYAGNGLHVYIARDGAQVNTP